MEINEDGAQPLLPFLLPPVHITCSGTEYTTSLGEASVCKPRDPLSTQWGFGRDFLVWYFFKALWRAPRTPRYVEQLSKVYTGPV